MKDRPHAKPGDSDYDHGASATLEYALSDAMLAQMARDLGHGADAERYAARAQSYRNIFDPRPASSAPGTPPAPSSVPPIRRRARGFHEGTSWQYQWLVPQDLPGMVDLIGGQQAANARLDSFFAYDQLLADPAKTAREVWVNGPYDYYNADKYNPQNEPDLIAPYTYLSTGQPWKTTDVVHAALTLFTDGPTGMTGNDDLGTMSAWNVLSSIRIFPVQPGYDTWGLSTPVFERVDLDPGPPLLPVRRPDHRGARHLRRRPLHPGGPDGRHAVRPYLSDDRAAEVRTVAGLHGRPAPVGVGYVTPGGTAGTEVTSGAS
ncbi:glycoside hydrolase domain-containing protein [Streptomyces sp. L7]